MEQQGELDKEQEEVLPIDKMLKIALDNGLLKDLTEKERWDKFIKGIQLHDIVYDCMQSSLNEYCKEYNKMNPEDALQLKLHIRKRHNKNSRVIFAVSLVLEMKRGGLYDILLEKKVEFTHIKDVRNEEAWKYSLYGHMFNALVSHSLNFLILQKDVKSGRIKPTIPSRSKAR